MSTLAGAEIGQITSTDLTRRMISKYWLKYSGRSRICHPMDSSLEVHTGPFLQSDGRYRLRLSLPLTAAPCLGHF
jgi:hypothetical protein